MTDPYRNETMAELIERKPGNLNILITALQGKPGLIGSSGRIASQPQQWNAVYVRYNYTALQLPDDDIRPIGRAIPIAGERFDPNAVNNAGRQGAYVAVPDRAAITQAVAELRAVWGDIPVQDNSR